MARMGRSRMILPLLLAGASVAVGAAILAAQTEEPSRTDARAHAHHEDKPGTALFDPAALEAVETVSVEGIAHLTVVLGDTPPSAQAAHEGDLEIALRDEGRRLVIEGPHRHSLFGSDPVPRVRLHLARLSRIDVDGAGRITLEGPVESLLLDIDGAAEATLSGPRCGELTVRIDGAGAVDAAELPCEAVRIAVDGAGKVEAHASHSARVGLDGIGSITVHGRPAEVSVDKDGLGTVRFPDRPDI